MIALRWPCAKPGCSELALINKKYCERHIDIAKKQKQEHDKLRESSCKRGYGRPWQRYRKVFLAEHPVCVSCEEQGKITPAAVVDHIQPHKGNYDLFWNVENHRALCKRCHDQVTAKFDGGFGNPVKREKYNDIR